MKNKTKIIIPLVLIVVTVIVILFVNFFLGVDKEYNKFVNDYIIVSESIDNTLQSEDFESLNNSQKASYIENTLKDLDKNGIIKNISCSEKIISFTYCCNDLQSGIVMSPIGSNDTWGNNSNKNDGYSFSTDVSTKTLPSKSNEKKQKWSIILGAEKGSVGKIVENGLQTIAKEYNNNIIDANYVVASNVFDYTNFNDNDLVYISAHGFHDAYSNKSIIWTTEEATSKKLKKKEYKKLIKDDCINIYTSTDSKKSYFVIIPEFFEKYYGENGLNDSVWIFNVCCLLGDNDSENTDFYQSLKKAGAKTVIGAYNSINQGYAFLFNETVLNRYLSGDSIGDAFSIAQTIIGKHEKEYKTNYPDANITKNGHFGTFRLLGDESLKIENYDASGWGQYGMTIVDSETQKPIKNVSVEVMSENSIPRLFKSGPNGEMNCVLPENTYDCILTCPEYKDKKIIIKVEKNVLTALLDSVVMEKSFSYEQVYYEYLLKNTKLIDCDGFEIDEKEDGIFSVLIDDFDDDKKKEMITFSYSKKDSTIIVLQLYKYKDKKVRLLDTSNPIYAGGGGNHQICICATYSDNLIRIYKDGYGFGGSTYFSEYLSFNVSNEKLITLKDYSLYEFYRYDNFEYLENIKGKKYSSPNSLMNAVSSDGFDYKKHFHVGYTNSKFDVDKDDYRTYKEFKGNHIFVMESSENNMKSGLYRFISDNTDLQNRIKKYSVSIQDNSKKGESEKTPVTESKTITVTQLKNKHKKAVDFFMNYIYGPCEYQNFDEQIKNGELTLTKYGEIDTYDELLAEAKKYFTEKVAVELLASISAQDYHGKLYTATNGGVGSVLMGEDVAIKEINDSKYHVKSTYYWPSDSTSQQERNFVYENGVWVLDKANFEY